MKKSWHGVGCRVKEQQQFKMPLFGRSGAHDAELRRPGQFGPYFLQELINSGGMASIWLATDTQGRAVAIRLLHHPLRFNFAARRRFLRGCEILSEIHSHEYVISYIAHGKIDGDLFLAMEYVDGENLELLCSRADPVVTESIGNILIDMAIALEHVHESGFMHLDFKPENVLLTRNARVRLVDFDLAPPKPEKPKKMSDRSEEHTSELQSRLHLVCRLLLEKKKKTNSK